MIFTAGVFAQEPAEDPSAQSIVLSEETNLAALVDLCSEQLDLNIEYDPAQLRGLSVTLRLGAGVTKEELWTLTNRLLAAYGWTTVRMPGEDVLSVVKLADAATRTRFDEQEAIPAPPGFLAAVRQIEHASPDAVIQAVTPLLSQPGGTAVRLGTTDLVLLSDLEPRLNDVMTLIDALDQTALGTEIVVLRIPLQFLDATNLAALVTAAVAARDALAARPLPGKLSATMSGDAVMLIAPADAVSSWQELIDQFDVQEPVNTRTYTPSHFSVAEVSTLIEQTVKSPRGGSGDRWRVINDELTGSLIITATGAEHAQVADLLARLEDAPMGVRRPMRTFTLRNRPAAEVLEVAQRLIEEGAISTELIESTDNTGSPPPETPPPTAPGTDSAITPAAPGDTSPPAIEEPAPEPRSASVRTFEDGRPALSLTADEATNSIIAIGEPRLLEQLEALIEILDVRQSQVEIEVLIVALNDSDSLDLGVELQKLEVSGNTLIGLSSLFGLSNVKIDDKSPFIGGRGFSGVILSPGDFSVVIRALQGINQGSSRSYPKLLVNNNEQATLDSVLQQPLLEINASDTVATTSFAGTLDAGTQVTVTPHIAEGDHLVLEYTIALSAFIGDSSDPTLPPPRQETSIQSVVTIPDGYTVVVGGLEATTDSNAISQIPLLGDIPGVGELFKKRSRSDTRSSFFIFIRADIMRHNNFEDLKHLSAGDIRAAGIDDGWPVLEPRIIR